MADSKIDLKALESIGTIGTNVAKTLDQLQKSAAATAKSVEDGASSTLNRALNASKTLADKLAGANADTVKSLAKQKEFTKDLAKVEVQRVKLMRQASYYGALAASATGKQAKAFRKLQADMLAAAGNMEDLADAAKDVEDSFTKLNKSTAFFDNMADLVQDIPVLRKTFREFQKASDAAREAGGGTASWIAGTKQLGGAVTKLAGAAGIGLLYEGFKRTDEGVISLARGLNTTKEAATAYRDILISANKSSLFSSVEFLESLNAVNSSLGSAGVISAESADNMALMNKRLGLSTEEAAKLYNLSAGTNQELSDQTAAITGTVLEYNALNNTAVDYKTVLKDIANASAATQLTTGKFAGGLARAASTARRFGLTLSQVDKIGESLLNFESSIEAELEAELLTGKQLNLEKARMAALTGDNATLAEELAKNMGSAEEFSKRNVIAQTALAKSMGMSRQEMAETLIKQNALKKVAEQYNFANFQNLSTEEKLAKLMAADETLDRAAALSKLGEEDLAQQERTRTLQEAQMEFYSKMKDQIDGNPFGAMTDGLTALNDSVKMLTMALLALGSISLLKNISQLKSLGKGFKNLKVPKGKGPSGSLLSSFKGSVASQKGVGAVMKGTGNKIAGASAEAAVKAGTATIAKTGGKTLLKAGGKVGGKMLLKRVPILGTVLGLGYAIDRLVKGDLAGAGMEAGSAGLSLLDLVVPGVGTASSLAADAAIAARDVKMQNAATNEPQMATGGIVSAPTRALVGEAGPEAVIPLNQFYAKIDELITAVKAGGNIYMDGSKVGTSISLAANKSN